jgi:hypothetical protein
MKQARLACFGVLLISAAAMAQDGRNAQGAPDHRGRRPTCAAQAQPQRPKSHGAVHAVGNAAVSAGSRVAGTAVAGPIGGAVAPVVVKQAGRAVKHVVKGDTKPTQQAEADCVRRRSAHAGAG